MVTMVMLAMMMAMMLMLMAMLLMMLVAAVMMAMVKVMLMVMARMVMMMHPCKNMHHLKGKTVPLVIGAVGQFIDAVAEITNMLNVDPTGSADPASTPLFRDPSTGRSITKQGDIFCNH